MPHVTSKDGTKIHYEMNGTGPKLVVVWGAMGVLESPFAKNMRDELAKSFTVYDYDRRGRGGSGDTQPYHVEKEIDDMRAVCHVAGGDAYVWATSSGAALALEAASAGVPMRMLFAHEPPYMVGEHAATFNRDYERQVTQLIAEGKRKEAVTLFMRTVGVPAPMVWVMKLMPFWKQMVAVAHTLPYDAQCMSQFTPPEKRLREIKVPTVLLYGTSTPQSLQAAAKEVARIVPNASVKAIPKQNHGIKPAALRPALLEVLK